MENQAAMGAPAEGVEEQVVAGEGSSGGVETSSSDTIASQSQEQIDQEAEAGEVENPLAEKTKPSDSKKDTEEGAEKTEEPEETADDESDLQAKIEKLEKENQANRKVNERLNQLWEQHPEIFGIIKDLDKGADLPVAIARHIDPEDLKPIDGEPDFEEWDKARSEREERQNQRKELEKTLDENIELSRKEMEEFKTENNLTEEKAQEFFDNVNEMLDQIFNGKLDKQTLSFFMEGMTAKEKAEEARKQGEIKGRNENIEAKKKETSKKKGDGLPGLSKNTNAGAPKEEAQQPAADPWASAFDKARTRQKF